MKRRRFSEILTTIFFITAFLSSLSTALQLDNGVVGTPQIHCSESSITFSVRSQSIFKGNIYIKNQYGTQQCREEYFTNDYNGASFSVRIGDCGMRRIRQLQPQGMNYMLVFVVNFHPQFVTKVDRAYNVRCFYAQTDKTVTSQLDVSMLQTQSLEQQTMLMPNCEYSVRSGTLNGPRVRFAKVGDRLVHRWECNNPNFGMLVKNCFVNDGSGNSIRVLDTRGCPVFTPVIQGPLQYDNSLNLAYVEIWAYKFPDRAQLYFQCQIQICNKRDNECVGVTPPNCPRVLKSNFQPSSTLNRNTDPNTVRGTFPSANVDNPGGFPNPNPIRPVVSGQGYPAGRTDANVDFIQNYQPSSNVDNFPSGLQPARPYRRKDQPAPTATKESNNGTDSTKDAAKKRRRKRSPTEIDVMKFISPDNQKRIMEELEFMDHSLNPNDDPESTLDVASDPVFIADTEDDDDDPGYTHFPFSTKRETYPMHGSICLNQLGIGLLMTTFALMLLLLCGLLFYVISANLKKNYSSSHASIDEFSGEHSSRKPPFTCESKKLTFPITFRKDNDETNF